MSIAPVQWLQASAVLLAYMLFCAACLRGRRPSQQALAEPAPTLVAYASQGGEAERLAGLHAQLLGRHESVALLPLNQLTSAHLQQARRALFVVSTYGEGEPPDNALRFQRQWLQGGKQSLEHLHFAVLALGDSSYRHFCRFGQALHEGLCELAARPMFAAITVDRLAADDLARWQACLQSAAVLDEGEQISLAPESAPSAVLPLDARVLLNPGSPGGPVYRLAFRAPATLDWLAGDIAEVLLPCGAVREYSIASLPADGSLDFVVRQVCKDDGSLGLGSGWLTRELAPGQGATLRIRRNPSFHPCEPGRPMVLVGNGTGIAGLRAHLKARQQAGAHANWLVFGERTRASDALFDEELRAWHKAGHLQQLSRVYSREGESVRYVQDLLLAEQAQLRDWLQRGAALYLCGSLEGMAPAVHRVLLDMLGEEGLEELTLAGRYRRDVY